MRLDLYGRTVSVVRGVKGRCCRIGALNFDLATQSTHVLISGYVGRELEENLGLIEEVTHYVKIVRSFAIMTLHFLKNLKMIRGHQLHNER